MKKLRFCRLLAEIDLEIRPSIHLANQDRQRRRKPRLLHLLSSKASNRVTVVFLPFVSSPSPSLIFVEVKLIFFSSVFRLFETFLPSFFTKVATMVSWRLKRNDRPMVIPLPESRVLLLLLESSNRLVSFRLVSLLLPSQ